MQARTLALVILLVQGIYDLSLGGWLWLARQSLAGAHANDTLLLHALYCRCQHCVDVENCGCVPIKHLANAPVVKQCDAASDAKLPNTWTARVVTTVAMRMPMHQRQPQAEPSSLLRPTLPHRIEHPPRELAWVG
jgi:hypothetical protein